MKPDYKDTDVFCPGIRLFDDDFDRVPDLHRIKP